MSLTDDDKRWFSGQLEKVHERVEERFAQMDARFAQVDARFAQVEARFERVEERIERVETTLLTEFYKWAAPVEARQRTHAAALHAVDLEMEALSDRVKKLEDRP